MLPYSVTPWLSTGLALAGLGLLCGTNMALSRWALNNAVPAKFDWKKEIVLITGGAGGIGGHTVRKLAKGGTRVVVVDVMELTYDKPDNVWWYQCDIANYEQLMEVAARIRQDVGEPTIVIGNAGVCRGKTLLQATKQDLELTVNVNTLGLLWTIKAFLPSLVASNHGHILIVSSQTAFHTTAGSTDYSATKAAAISIYEGLQTELRQNPASQSVRVSLVKPSHVHTNMFNGIRAVPGMTSVSPGHVADEIVGILKSGRSQDRWIPGVMMYTPLIRIMPVWVRVLLQDMTAGAFKELKPHDPFQKFNKERAF